MGRARKRRLITDFPLLETGLWSAHAAALWTMELALSQKQGAELRITAPDEAEARAAFEAANPGRARDRAETLASLDPPDWFGSDDEDEDAADDDAGSEEE